MLVPWQCKRRWRASRGVFEWRTLSKEAAEPLGEITLTLGGSTCVERTDRPIMPCDKASYALWASHLSASCASCGVFHDSHKKERC